MLRFLILLPLCLIHVTALQLTLLSDPLVLGSSAQFKWDALDTDPDAFTMQIAQDDTTQFPFSKVNRGGKSQGEGSTPALIIPGPHTLQAIVPNGQILNEIHFDLPAPGDGDGTGTDTGSGSDSGSAASETALSQSPTSSSTTDPKESSSTTGTSKTTSSTAEKDPQTATSTSGFPPSAASTSSDSHPPQNIASNASGTTGLTDAYQITSTTLGINPAFTPNSQTTSGSSSKSKTPLILGIVLGVIVAVAILIIGAIFFVRRRRRLQAIVSQFDRERMVRGPSPMPSERTSNPRFDTPSMHDDDSPPYPDDEESPGYPQDKYRDSYPAEKYDDDLAENGYTVDADGQ
ncbi:hypothetical protein C8J56DRAFT_985855 [Mycena floridula]|nr:hypothetical protein C8J56DRAFT_985855 [Mycena floridula]